MGRPGALILWEDPRKQLKPTLWSKKFILYNYYSKLIYNVYISNSKRKMFMGLVENSKDGAVFSSVKDSLASIFNAIQIYCFITMPMLYIFVVICISLNLHVV